MPSSFSSTDGCQDFVLDDYLVPDDLLRDIEIFADHVNRLRIALDSSSYVPDGESKCVQVKAALSMVSQSVRDLLVRYPLFKTTQVLIPTSHLVHSVKEINFSDVVIDTSKTLSCIDKLEGAVGNTLKQSLNVQNNMQQVDKNKKDSSSVNRLSGKYSTPAMSSTPPCPSSKIPLIRRHSTFKGKVSSENQGPINAETLDARLANHDDGLNVAFECTKTQGKHFKDITAYIKKRITLEQEHATKLTALTKETRSVLRNDCHLPLLQNFFYCFETDLGLCEKVNNIFNALMEKIKESEKNRDDEELFKRSLKNEVAKDIKQLKDFENELVKARNNFLAKEDNFKKAKNAYIRIEKNLISSSYSMESKRNIKEIDKKKRSEEDAMNKMEDAENQVKKLESEMRRKFLSLEKSKVSFHYHARI
uniref:F-BAR domain-containing protein n=1 Tax=Rhabditophanes sp. KR3021 TaxID=114890 RepID=A0AC35U067_9BILA